VLTFVFSTIIRVFFISHGAMILLELPVNMHPATAASFIVIEVWIISEQLSGLFSVHCAVDKVLLRDALTVIPILHLLGNGCFED